MHQPRAPRWVAAKRGQADPGRRTLSLGNQELYDDLYLQSRCHSMADWRAAILCLIPALATAADRPDAAHLLPENTVLYVRFPNTAETVAKFQETALAGSRKIRE